MFEECVYYVYIGRCVEGGRWLIWSQLPEERDWSTNV